MASTHFVLFFMHTKLAVMEKFFEKKNSIHAMWFDEATLQQKNIDYTTGSNRIFFAISRGVPF